MYKRFGTLHAVTHISFDVFVTVYLCQYNHYFKLLLIDDEISGYFKPLHSPVPLTFTLRQQRYENIQGRVLECILMC